jgi:hypothetical protein
MSAPEIHTPADVKAMFAAKGLNVSERSIRERARQTGYCRVQGKALFFLDEDIALLLEAMRPEPKPCLTSTSAAPSGTTRLPSKGSAFAQVRARLTKSSPQTQPSSTRAGTVVPLSMARNR